MPPEPRVSVVLPNRNGGRYLGWAVQSVLSQTLTDLELIVVDGGSTDGSLEAVQAVRSWDPRVRVLTNREGLSSSLNMGYAQARGEYVARMDSDDVCRSTRLSRQAAALDAGGRDVCWTDAQRIDAAGTPLGRMWTCNYLSARQLVTGDVFGALLRQNFIPHGSVMARRSALPSPPLNPWVRYAEDWDLWVRMAAAGSRFTHVHEPLYRYRVHAASSGGFRNLKDQILWRAVRVPRRWLADLPMTPRQRARVALTMATLPLLSVGSGLLGNYRPDLAKGRAGS